MERLVKEMKEINDKPLILFQINHSGSVSGADFSKVVSVCPTEDPNVHFLTEEEIEAIREMFVKAAVLSKQAGADGIDFKHCHGYFCAEMLRPANVRQDRYGGTFENRTRFFKETIEKIKTAVGGDSFLLGTRYSIYEGIPGGFGTEGPGRWRRTSMSLSRLPGWRRRPAWTILMCPREYRPSPMRS